MISAQKLNAMQQSWVRLLGRLGISPADAYPPFDNLVARYQEPHRHYHDLEHLAEVLKVVGKLADMATDLDAILLAAWYHDAVYDPRAKDNEEQSAELMRTAFAGFAVPAKMIDRAASMIRATAHAEHERGDGDTAILLDADLAILGAEEKRYLRYSEAIRQEYDWVDAEAYRSGRTKVLEAFLKRERIYRTEWMFAVGEEAARRNLVGELERLRQI